MFYVILVAVALVIWLLYGFLRASLTPGVDNSINFSFAGLLLIIIIGLAMRQGYRRGWRKEAIFAGVLIVAYGLRDFLRDLIVNVWNFLAYSLVVPQLNSRGITKIDPEASKFRPDATAQNVMSIIIFLTIAIAGYAFTSGKPKAPTKPGEKPNAKDVFGAVIGGVNAALLATYVFILTGPSLSGLYNNDLFAPLKLNMPNIKLPDVSVQSRASGPPTAGLERWLPVVILGVIGVYIIYKVFINPPSKTKTRLSTGTIVGVALLVAIVFVFAVRQT